MEAALTARLLGTAALTALVGQRISWDARGDGEPLPAVVLHLIDRVPVYADDGDAGIAFARVQIDCWAEDQSGVSGSTQAKAIGDAVRTALGDVEMTIEDVEFQGVFPESERDFTEVATGGSKIYRRSLDFELWS